MLGGGNIDVVVLAVGVEDVTTSAPPPRQYHRRRRRALHPSPRWNIPANGGVGLAFDPLGGVTRARAPRLARLLVHESPEVEHELRYPAVGGFDRRIVPFRVHLSSQSLGHA